METMEPALRSRLSKDFENIDILYVPKGNSLVRDELFDQLKKEKGHNLKTGRAEALLVNKVKDVLVKHNLITKEAMLGYDDIDKIKQIPKHLAQPYIKEQQNIGTGMQRIADNLEEATGYPYT